MSTFDGNNHYFSGQGVVMVGDRDSAGKPKRLIPVGNVSDLKLGLATTTLEHKESQTGNRAIDLRLITELKSSISMTIENFSSKQLANALAGSVTEKLGGTVTGEAPKLYIGSVIPLLNIKVSAVTVKNPYSTSLTAYTNDTTAYDYKLNDSAGSIQINDGSVVATDKLTTASTITAPTGITVGNPTVLTWAATPPTDIVNAGVGAKMVVSGLTGADAALMNKLPFTITAIDTAAKTVSLNVNTTGKTITIGVPLIAVDGTALSIDYTYAAQNLVDSMTVLAAEKYMRFEGLNTADSGAPVIVEVFRFVVDPLKELALISEGIGPFVLEGNVLADSLQSSGSKFFKVTMVR